MFAFSLISTYLFLEFDSVKRPRYHCQDLYKIQFESLQIVRLGIELFWLFEWNFDEFIKIIFKKNQNPIRKKVRKIYQNKKEPNDTSSEFILESDFWSHLRFAFDQNRKKSNLL